MSFVRHYEMSTTPEQADNLATNLSALRDAVLGCDGCLRVDLLRDTATPGRFIFIEHWGSKAQHGAAGSNLPPAVMTALKSLLTAPPKATDLTDDVHTA